MGWPQWTIAVLMALNIVVAFAMHGKPRTPWRLGEAVLGMAVLGLLLGAGGFWS